MEQVQDPERLARVWGPINGKAPGHPAQCTAHTPVTDWPVGNGRRVLCWREEPTAEMVAARVAFAQDMAAAWYARFALEDARPIGDGREHWISDDGQPVRSKAHRSGVAEPEPPMGPDDRRPARVIAPQAPRKAPRAAQRVKAGLAPRVKAPTRKARPAPQLVKAAPQPIRPETGRPTCSKCGQSFRRKGTGYAWHMANRHAPQTGKVAA